MLISKLNSCEAVLLDGLQTPRSVMRALAFLCWAQLCHCSSFELAFTALQALEVSWGEMQSPQRHAATP